MRFVVFSVIRLYLAALHAQACTGMHSRTHAHVTRAGYAKFSAASPRRLRGKAFRDEPRLISSIKRIVRSDIEPLRSAIIAARVNIRVYFVSRSALCVTSLTRHARAAQRWRRHDGVRRCAPRVVNKCLFRESLICERKKRQDRWGQVRSIAAHLHAMERRNRRALIAVPMTRENRSCVCFLFSLARPARRINNSARL